MEHLDRLENVNNARDFADATPNIAPGALFVCWVVRAAAAAAQSHFPHLDMLTSPLLPTSSPAGRIFRSGNPANGSLSDVQTLRQSLGIRQLFDFRSAEEQAEDTGWSLMLSNGVIKCYDVNGDLTQVTVDHNPQLGGLEDALPRCDLHRLSLLERDRFVRALIWRLPMWKVAQALAYKVAGYHERMRDILVPEINRAGLYLVYSILLDTAAADIRRALELMAAAAEARSPQLIFCKLGKDRTGVMSALVLACCGASDAEIVADYARSDGVDQVALGGLEKMKDVEGMDKALFASAPPEAMRTTLRYAQERYGGLTNYMVSIGFGREAQAALAAALRPETQW